MEFVSSQKKKQKINANGLIYIFQKDLANKVCSNECELRRKGQCRAKIKLHLDDNVITQLNEHTHPPPKATYRKTPIPKEILGSKVYLGQYPRRNGTSKSCVEVVHCFP